MHRKIVLLLLLIGPFHFSRAAAQTESISSAASITDRSSSFRPTPLRGESQIRGRSMSLRDQMNTNRIYLMSPATNSVSSVSQILQQSAQSRAAIRAAQARSSRSAVLSLRQTSVSPQSRHQVSHVVQLAIEPVETSARFDSIQSGDRQRTLANLKQRMDLRNVDIYWEGSTVVLEGNAPNEQRRRVLHRILLLEPGVDAVDDRLIQPGM